MSGEQYYIYVRDRYYRKWYLCTNGRFTLEKNIKKRQIFITLGGIASAKTRLVTQSNIDRKKIETGFVFHAPDPVYIKKPVYRYEFKKRDRHYYKKIKNPFRTERKIGTL